MILIIILNNLTPGRNFREIRVIHHRLVRYMIANLRLVKAWTENELITSLRTGVNPGGRELSPLMPWRSTGRLDDLELSALYKYLISLE